MPLWRIGRFAPDVVTANWELVRTMLLSRCKSEWRISLGVSVSVAPRQGSEAYLLIGKIGLRRVKTFVTCRMARESVRMKYRTLVTIWIEHHAHFCPHTGIFPGPRRSHPQPYPMMTTTANDVAITSRPSLTRRRWSQPHPCSVTTTPSSCLSR